MIKQSVAVRSRAARLIDDMLFALRTHITMLPILESDILIALEPTSRVSLVVEITDLLLAKFGQVDQPKEPRFSKTRRALSKRTPKGPRGVPRKQRQTSPLPTAPAQLEGDTNAA